MGSVKNYSEQHRSRRLHTQTRDNSAGQTEERGRGRELHHRDAGTSESSFQRETEMETGEGVPCRGCQACGKVRDGGTEGRTRSHAKSKESSKSKGKLDLTTQQCRDPESLKRQSALQIPECLAAELAKLSGSKICPFSPQELNSTTIKKHLSLLAT